MLPSPLPAPDAYRLSYTTALCTFCPWAFVPATVTVRNRPRLAVRRNNDVVGRQHLPFSLFIEGRGAFDMHLLSLGVHLVDDGSDAVAAERVRRGAALVREL